MDDKRIPADAGDVGPPAQGLDGQPGARYAGSEADSSALPDSAPTADAFDTLTSSHALEPGDDDRDDDDDRADATAPAQAGWIARLPGNRRHWTTGGMVAGGVLLGALLSGGIAWNLISSRNAEVAARNARLDLQSSRLAEQAAKIEVLTRAISERPLSDDPLPLAPQESALAAAKPATVPAPAPIPEPAPAPSASRSTSPVAVAQVASAAPAAVPRADLPKRVDPEPISPGSAAPGQAGSGICDVPGGSDGAARMRKCLEWFAGRDKGGARPAP